MIKTVLHDFWFEREAAAFRRILGRSKRIETIMPNKVAETSDIKQLNPNNATNTATMINAVQRNRRQRRRTGSQILHKRYPSLQSIPEDDLKEFGDDLSIPSSPTSVRTLPPLHQHQPKSSPRDPHQPKSLVLDALHVVNEERSFRGLEPFRCSHWLNQLASQQASAMAITGNVFHSVTTIDELVLLLSSTEVAENIQRGDSVEGMHRETMNNVNAINRSNLLSTYFSEFGCGFAIGRDGKLYSCQLFRN